MIQVAAQMRILVAVEPQDFRKGIDGLCRVCRDALSSDPLSGTVFVFRNRRGTAIKLLSYDGQGFWLCQKRLSASRFGHWPRAAGSVKRELLAHELQVLLSGGNPDATGAAPQWRPIVPAVAAPGS
jgi:transposase